MSEPNTALRLADEQDIKELEGKIKWLETSIGIQSYNGLFKTQKAVTRDECYSHVESARRQLQLPYASLKYTDFIEASKKYAAGWAKLEEAFHEARLRYRLRYKYGLLGIVFLAIWFAVLIVGVYVQPTYLSNFLLLNAIPLQVAAAGGIGAGLRAAWNVYDYVQNIYYGKNMDQFALVSPGIGVLLGIAIYAGYNLAVGQTPITAYAIFFAIIGGYGWYETIKVLDRLAQKTVGSLLA